MKRNIFLVLILSSFILASCEKEAPVAPVKAPVQTPQTPTDVDTQAPSNKTIVADSFNWASSRNVNFYILMSTEKYQGVIHLISIYEGDPAEGKLLGKGSLTDQSMFKCTLYLPNQLKNITIVCTAPDNTKTMQKWAITESDRINAKLVIQ